MKYLDLYLKENLIRQTSFLPKNSSKKPASFRVKLKGLLNEILFAAVVAMILLEY